MYYYSLCLLACLRLQMFLIMLQWGRVVVDYFSFVGVAFRIFYSHRLSMVDAFHRKFFLQICWRVLMKTV